MRALTLPARGFGVPRRTSRLLFAWEARDGGLIARTGQIGTFTRASVGTAFDSNAMLRPLVHSVPRVTYIDTDGDGVLEPHLILEDARTNAAISNRDLTNAAWTKTNATAAKDQIGIDGVAGSASSLVATAGNATCLQAITLASSARFQTAYVKRLVGTGTIQMTTDNGSTWTAITLTSAWTRVSIPTQTLANPTVGFRIVTNGDKIAVDFVQNENGIFATSAIPTTTVAVPRAADVLTFPFEAAPRLLTVYVDAVWSVAVNAGTNYVAFAIGTPTSPYLVGRLAGSTLTPETQHHNGVGAQTSSAAGAPSLNQRAETRHVLRADGSTITAIAVNSGAEIVGSPATAAALAAAWNPTTLRIGTDSMQAAFFAVRSVRIAAGERSLEYMRRAG